MILSKQISPLLLLSSLFFLCFLEKIDAVVHSASKSFVKNYKHLDPDFTIHKVSLTQKGYIQFLKYVTTVPVLTDYTFCIWVRSDNFTYNQPLLSYSKNEEERLIRVWISPLGTDLNLEILNHPITIVPVNMIENQWCHVCQSWSSHQATWNIFINGKLMSSGYVPKLKGVQIKGGGDIVVGQEYTDFDKGLDDGIEGDVFGFNFVLSSTTTAAKHPADPIKLADYPLRRYFGGGKRIRPQLRPPDVYPPPQLQFNFEPEVGRKHLIVVNNIGGGYSQAADVLGYFESLPKRQVKFYRDPFDHHTFPFHKFYGDRRILSNSVGSHHKPLGLLLVELSFDCGLKKGAPLSGKNVLINWTKTTVRVFGGAILTKIPPFCRKIDYLD